MKQGQKGFTMIELIVVIVILGILAATAIPKFIDMSSDARSASAKGVAAAAASAMTLNYSGCSLTNHAVTAGKCVKVSACTDISTQLQGGLPTGYAIAASGTAMTTTNGATAECKVSTGTGSTLTEAGFTGISAGN